MEPLAPRQPWLRTARPLLRPLLLAAALPREGAAQGSWETSRFVRAHPDCFRGGFKYHPDIPHTNVKAESLRHCQVLCSRKDGCAYFSYWPSSSDCYFSDFKARLYASQSAIAGHGVCPQEGGMLRPTCSAELPGNGFPGFNGKASNGAWPSGRQPQSLECWPRNNTGGYLACSKVTILEDSEVGWPGKCRGLVKQPGALAQCAEECKRNPLCPSWQTGMDGCKQGMGRDCFVRPDFTPIRAQRIQHGDVRVLWNLTGWQIVGLAKAFDNHHGYFLHMADAISACKKVCYSDIRCQYWQYTPKYGCWVEDASESFHPPWPLTSQWAYRSTQFALDCVAGEYIQHSCPVGMAVPYEPYQLEVSRCMSRGYKYDPPDMRWAGRTVEMSAEACQARCNSTADCSFFTYEPDGGCHLEDKEAERVVAYNRNVISGPARCEQPHSRQPVTTQAPSQSPRCSARVAEILVPIHHLHWSVVATSKKTQAAFQKKYAEEVANVLRVDTTDIRSSPEKHPGVVLLTELSRTTLERGTLQGTLLAAYTENKPPCSDNPERLKSTVRTKKLRRALYWATHQIADRYHLNSSKYQSVVFEFMKKHGKENITKGIKINLEDIQVNILPASNESLGASDSEIDIELDWWPLSIGLLLVVLCVGVAAGVVYFGKKAKPKQKKRGPRSKADPGSPGTTSSLDFSSMASSQLESTRLSEQMPLVDVNGLTPDMGTRGFIPAYDPFAHQKRGNEFYV